LAKPGGLIAVLVRLFSGTFMAFWCARPRSPTF